MWPAFNTNNRTLLNDGTSRFDANLNPKGGFWGYLEVGRYKVLPKGSFFKYYDVGLSYKGLTGSEQFSGDLISTQDTVMATTSGTSKFRDHNITGHFNLNHIWELTDFHFLQNSIGVNVDYAFVRTFQNQMDVPGVTPQQPGQLMAQLHYKLGFGFKPNDRLLVIMALETPVVGLYPLGENLIHTGYFNSNYRPFILSLRFMPLIPWREKNCAPVKTRQGPVMPTDIKQQN